ncbi:MAG: ChaN family lipoprotein [Bacteroidota bacterium]
MRKLLLLLSLLLILSPAFSQKKPYVIYNANGKKVSYRKMIKTLGKKDIVLFGEEHNNAIAHWLQYEVATDLHESRQLILGAEMIEADNQNALDDYLAKDINYKQLDSAARLWPNYKTDYAPIVDFARENQLRFIATNILRRYANLVYKKGFDALLELTAEEKEWIAPLPIPFDSELPTYKKIVEEMGDHGSPALVKAQAIKDATMAHFILFYYEIGSLFLHLNGAFHSDYYEGILWYLKKEFSGLDYATISTVSQENVNKLQKSHLGKADFIICVDQDMTRTY